MANTLINTIENNPSHYKRLYDNNLSVEEKVTEIAKEIYRADKVIFEKKAKTQIAQIVKNGWDTYQFVWLRHSTVFQTIDWVPQLALILLFVNWFPVWVQVLSLHLQEMS